MEGGSQLLSKPGYPLDDENVLLIRPIVKARVAEDHLGFYHSETWTSLRVMMKIFGLNPINEKTNCKVFQISRSGSPSHFQRGAAGVHHREGLTLTNLKL